MGYGDELLASGLARGAKDRGKRIAFGDGNRIIWGPWCEEVFRHNPNVAPPGSEGDPDIEWVPFYKGNRGYHLGVTPTHWRFNMDFRPVPGQVFFDQWETNLASDAVAAIGARFVLIEPNTPPQKSMAVNKQWPVERFQAVADRLQAIGHHVVQLSYPSVRSILKGVDVIATTRFRHAISILSRAALFIGGEGGMHHGAAAVHVPAVVLFGGYTPVELTGYPPLHINLVGNSTKACGSLYRCQHCIDAMDSITVDEVELAALRLLR